MKSKIIIEKGNIYIKKLEPDKKHIMFFKLLKFIINAVIEIISLIILIAMALIIIGTCS